MVHFTAVFSHHGKVRYIYIYTFFLGYSRVRVVFRCQYVHRRTRKSPDLELKYDILYSGEHNKRQCPDHNKRQTFAADSGVCVCFLPMYSGRQIRWKYLPGHTGFLIHLPSAVRTFIFPARRIQPFLSLIDREVDLRKNPSYRDGFEFTSQRVRRLRG